MSVRPFVTLKPKPHVHARRFDNEIIILDLDRGLYFGLDEVGAAIWDAFASGQTLKDVVASLLTQYDVPEDQLARDTSALVTRLVEEGLATTHELTQ